MTTTYRKVRQQIEETMGDQTMRPLCAWCSMDRASAQHPWCESCLARYRSAPTAAFDAEFRRPYGNLGPVGGQR